MGNQVDAELNDRQTLACWHALCYCTDARAHLDYMVIRLNVCRFDKQCELGWIAEKVLVKVRVELNVELVINGHGAPGSRIRLTQEQC
jgi:hypothetical protein